ncbi:MOSC domain-containing protein [Nitrogeniibacter mangrovi]|uniref:MOSC domain-containing protein n=1 Tax=Nitrogeniibacter mangrovi TaxID=2016596 RepID=A0A6C1B151_9RHOO|nr:MOSC domain-containing protein [Nitrogeniibacter mangrovi]QID17346.1 MOSC domain-containing protein [Nitrogeniibacter mangrovi]
MNLKSTIDLVFAGGMGVLAPEGQRSGIFKRRIAGPARVEAHGIVGDEHGDPRVHGGPEKAVHQYAADNYAHLAQAFPQCSNALVPGSLGENLSALHLTERNVHIGDIFRAGSTVLQVSQPRSPCWKISHRFGIERMSMHVAQTRITGWYYRVIEPGLIQQGDEMRLLDRQTERFSIDQFWQVQSSHRPALDDLLELAAVPGLAEDWKRRLIERVKWLRKHVAAAD